MGRVNFSPFFSGIILFILLLNMNPTIGETDIDNMEFTDHYIINGGDEPSEQNFKLPSLLPTKSNITSDSPCRLKPADNEIHKNIQNLLLQYIKLLEYQINIVNHTENPLLNESKWTYKLDQWARVSHSHGQTILSLAFNYGVLSLMTLSFGVANMDVDLVEEPHGCLLQLQEEQKVELLLDLLLRDFSVGGSAIPEGHIVCHQMIKNVNGYAKFTDQCCYINHKTGQVRCLTDYPNMWLNILETLMALITLIVIFFGPLATPKFFSGAGLEVIRYIVKLKEPLYKTLCVQRVDDVCDHTRRGAHVIDLRYEKGFPNAKSVAENIPTNALIPIKISEYNISVSYEKLLPENNVPVGFWTCLIRAIFLCKMQSTEAVQDCCDANLFGCVRESQPLAWISICRVLGRILMVLFFPLPFYIRLVMYYTFEEPEVILRHSAAERTGLPLIFEYRILQYLTPTHPLFLATYVIYYTSGFIMAAFSARQGKSRFQRVIFDSFRDLYELSALPAIGMVVKNFLWPFKKLGVFGLFFGIIYWPLIIPPSVVVAVFNCLPMVFLTFRMLFHALGVSTREKHIMEQTLPGELRSGATGIQMLEADALMNTLSSQNVLGGIRRYFQNCDILGTIANLVLAVISISTFYVVTLLVSECVSFILSICVFTMMGIIVNAGKVLKYGALIFMVILYSYDCYNNVYLQYVKLNRALFSEIKSRIKDIWEVTMLPSYLQENRGFKSQENSDQADHEIADDLYGEDSKQWVINDLILFIDNNDVPRIPKKLFEEVCDIEVPGSPGPVYRSLLKATGKFLLIILFLLFVFIVVLSFGDVYKISSTNQMLATMAGGFMPFIFRNLLKPAQPSTELGSVSFKSKLEEIVINFYQYWPLYDFRFEIEEEPEADEKSDKGGDDDGADKKKDKDKKGDKKGDKKDKKMSDSIKRHSMAELLDEVDYVPTKEEVIQILQETKTYRPADGQSPDIILLLGENVSQWSIGPVAEDSNGDLHLTSVDRLQYPVGNNNSLWPLRQATNNYEGSSFHQPLMMQEHNDSHIVY